MVFILFLSVLQSAEGPKPSVFQTTQDVQVVRDPDAFTQLPRLAVEDVKRVVQAPKGWSRSQWGHVGLGSLCIVGAALALDEPVDRWVSRHGKPSWDRASEKLTLLGGNGSLVTAGGAYLCGTVFDSAGLRAFGVDACASMGIAQLAFVIPLKQVLGRSRPRENEGAHHFKPFHGGKSFPSGHTTQAFALAAVISGHANQSWVTATSYGVASLVGLTRISLRAHHLSDVLVGAVIGTWVGKTVTSFNQSIRKAGHSKVNISAWPVIEPDYQGAALRVNF